MSINGLIQNYTRERNAFDAEAHKKEIVAFLLEKGVKPAGSTVTDGSLWSLSDGSLSFSIFEDGEEIHWGNIYCQYSDRYVIVDGRLLENGGNGREAKLPDFFEVL